jgi:DnaK suppressor protein
MAKDPRSQQKTDGQRIGASGTGKLDATGPAGPPRRRGRPRARRDDHPAVDDLRDRLLRERQAAVDALARLGISPEIDDATGTGESPFEESDVAQASERLDMSFAHRERLAERINRLTRALERLAHGDYGVCERCHRPIEAGRLAAVPETTLCRECQEQLERGRAA